MYYHISKMSLYLKFVSRRTSETKEVRLKKVRKEKEGGREWKEKSRERRYKSHNTAKY